MHPKSLKWLNDIHQACKVILTATADRALAEYESDRLLQSGVERNFEIIGEALGRIRKIDPDTAERVPNCDVIIAFRNLLIHGYDFIDNPRVWEVIKADVPRLDEQVAALLRESEDLSTGAG